MDFPMNCLYCCPKFSLLLNLFLTEIIGSVPFVRNCVSLFQALPLPWMKVGQHVFQRHPTSSFFRILLLLLSLPVLSHDWLVLPWVPKIVNTIFARQFIADIGPSSMQQNFVLTPLGDPLMAILPSSRCLLRAGYRCVQDGSAKSMKDNLFERVP